MLLWDDDDICTVIFHSVIYNSVVTVHSDAEHGDAEHGVVCRGDDPVVLVTNHLK